MEVSADSVREDRAVAERWRGLGGKDDRRRDEKGKGKTKGKGNKGKCEPKCQKDVSRSHPLEFPVPWILHLAFRQGCGALNQHWTLVGQSKPLPALC